jgi:hypothetical protein
MDVIWDDLAELMNDVCTFYAKSTQDKYGKLTYASARTVRGRLIYDTSMMRETDQRKVNPSGKFITVGVPTTAITSLDKMALPDGTVVTITMASIVNDENGEHHQVVQFG